MSIIIDIIFVKIEYSTCGIDQFFVFCFTFLSKAILKPTPVVCAIPV